MRGRSRAVAASALVLLAAGVVAGCGGTPGKQATTAAGGGPGPTASVPATRCGTVRTAAGVPVDVDVAGQVPCQDAMTVERDYTRALASGKVPGNGGGAPVKIRGWVCQGYDTPEVLATGRASACRKQGMRILAVLVLPSPSSSPSS
jgi:hypothetical protein